MKRTHSTDAEKSEPDESAANEGLAGLGKIEINTTQSVEIRESFHEPRQSEEIQVWRSASEKDFDWNDESLAGLTAFGDVALHLAGPSSPLPSSEGSVLLIEGAKATTISTTEPTISGSPPPSPLAPDPLTSPPTSPPPTSKLPPLPHQQNPSEQPSFITAPPPAKANANAANPVNSSQLWATPNPSCGQLIESTSAQDESRPEKHQPSFSDDER